MKIEEVEMRTSTMILMKNGVVAHVKIAGEIVNCELGSKCRRLKHGNDLSRNNLSRNDMQPLLQVCKAANDNVIKRRFEK